MKNTCGNCVLWDHANCSNPRKIHTDMLGRPIGVECCCTSRGALA